VNTAEPTTSPKWPQIGHRFEMKLKPHKTRKGTIPHRLAGVWRVVSEVTMTVGQRTPVPFVWCEREGDKAEQVFMILEYTEAGPGNPISEASPCT
jgi:hypothetical protein